MKEISVEASIQELEQMGIQRFDAVDCLKACNGNLARAAEYFWNGDLEKARNDKSWSEDVWAAPREGHGPALPPGHDNTFSQFQIQSADVLAPNVYEPKSRPPSRISNRIDLTIDEDGTFSRSGFIEKKKLMISEIPDPELARALAASMQDSSGSQSGYGSYSQQETGVTGTHTSPTNPNFRDAVPGREYDSNRWALTTTQTHEIFLPPSPLDRKRQPGEPVFLKPINSGSSNLSAAFTILHSIPSAREALLARNYCRSDYGHDDQWWDGQNIRMLRIINVDDEVSQVPEELVEVQRLIAFLDQSTRAYGSAEGIEFIGGNDRKLGPISTFFTGWTNAVARAITEESEAGKYTKTFISYATQRPREEQSKSNVEVEEKYVDFQNLQLSIPPDDDYTFYDALDKIIWFGDDESEVFVEFADIVCISIALENSDTPGRGCKLDIPKIFYPNRYTEAWTEPVRAIKKQIEEKRCLIYDIGFKEEKLKSFKSSKVGSVRNPSAHEPKLLLESILQHFSAPQPPIASNGGVLDVVYPESQKDDVMESQQDIAIMPQKETIIESQSETPDISHMLENILSQLEKKLNDLALRKDEAHKALKKLKSAYTSPENSDPAMPTLEKYSLRGVCVDPATTFVLIPFLKPGGVSVDGAPSSSAGSPTEQWWCLRWGPPKSNIGWSETPIANYGVNKVTEEEVFEAIKTTGNGSLFVVYANENALNPEGGIDTSLPGPLQTFVDRDNAAFKAEIQPASPGRKRHNDWLEDNDEAVDVNSFSPKKMSSSSRSSATLGNVTPQHSRRNSADGTEMEMTEGVDPLTEVANIGMSRVGEGDIAGTMLELPSPHQEEMSERGHISPVVKVFHLDLKGRGGDIDQEMMDAEHFDYTNDAAGGAKEEKKRV